MSTNQMTARLLVLGNPVGRVDEPLAEIARNGAHGAAAARTLTRLTALGVGLVCRELGTVANGLLDLDVAEVVLQGWQLHKQIEDAKDATRDNPGDEVVVPLVTHTRTSTYSPAVDVLVRGVPVTRLELEIRLDVTASGVLAVVRDGDVVDVRSGRLDVVGTLSCEKVQVAQHGTSFPLASTSTVVPVQRADMPGETVDRRPVGPTAPYEQPGPGRRP